MQCHHCMSEATSLPVSLHANTPRKAVGDGPRAWALAVHVGDLDGMCGSKLWPDPALAVAYNHRGSELCMEDILCVFVFVFLPFRSISRSLKLGVTHQRVSSGPQRGCTVCENCDLRDQVASLL